MTSAWPPRYLVAEWTTTAAPCSIGRQKRGEATVLSTTSGTPAAAATSASAGRSATAKVGLAMVSTYTPLVPGLHAAATACGSPASTKVVSTPRRAATVVSRE